MKLQIFSITGQLVRDLVDERQTAGRYAVTWVGLEQAGHHVASGTYFYRLRAGDLAEMVFLKLGHLVAGRSVQQIYDPINRCNNGRLVGLIESEESNCTGYTRISSAITFCKMIGWQMGKKPVP